MNPDIEKIIDEKINKAMYGTGGALPYHTHNGIDSPRLSGSQSSGTITTFVPKLFIPATSNEVGSRGVSGTTAYVGLFNLPATMTVSQITWRSPAVTTTGAMNITVYSEDGQTKYFNLATQSISASGTYTDALSTPVTLSPGNYYLMMSADATASASVFFWNYYQGAGGAGDFVNVLSGYPTYCGSLTISLGVPPATFDPSAVSALNDSLLECRMDS